MSRGRGVASVLLGVAIASGAGALWTAGAFSRTAGGQRGATPAAVALLSPRRAPEALAQLAAAGRLQTRLDTFLRTVPGEECLAVDAGARRVARHNETAKLIPASTVKLLTARAAARSLGPTFVFETTVSGPEPDDNGTVAGDLVLTGSGDPVLATSDYASTRKRPIKRFTDVRVLAERTRRAGVRHVTGRVVGVDDAFDRERLVPTWRSGYVASGDVGPVGALAVNDGFISYGARYVAAADPALAAAELFRAELVRQGVTVDGPAARAPRGFSAKGASLVTLESPPLRALLEQLLTDSDNNTAELLARRVALVDDEAPATRSEAVAAVRAALAADDLPAGDAVLVDASGLDRGDRATCRLLLGALRPARRVDLVPLLAQAGRSGTLVDRFRGHPLEGRLRAKTGALEGVVGLVGVTDPDDDGALRFAFLANGAFNEAAGRQLQERLAAVLATYPEAPAVSAIAP